ncbi:Zinc finger CCHC-type protein [Dioscorea alata]|uniref:Zinc finger CCHC-type protein n=1 Tax=Dioscorea alata TaxID=55571 RepID=A0ACB7WMW2_DIOAL|nr:Zinc finger CCHC-type protein [Dioscorea alata]
MSLLGDLWGGDGGCGDDARGSSSGGTSSQQAGGGKRALRRQDTTYVQAVCSSPSGDRVPEEPRMPLSDSAASRDLNSVGTAWTLVQNKKRKSVSPRTSAGVGAVRVGSKRQRSPMSNSDRCSRCFRTSHSTADCRHQVVCRRCECAGHVAVNCPLETRGSPHRKKNRLRPRMSPEKGGSVSLSLPNSQGSNSEVLGRPSSSQAKLSIPIPREAEEIRDNLEMVAILSLRSGQISENVLAEAIPNILNIPLKGPITPVNDDNYIIPLGSKDEVKMACSLGVFELSSKQGLCSMSISPWSADFGTLGRASGIAQWVLIWNIPLHGWCRNVISEILRPLGDLVALSKTSRPNKSFISALVRRKPEVVLPFEIDLSYGMRCYNVIITGDKGEFPRFRRDLGRFVLPVPSDEPPISIATRTVARDPSADDRLVPPISKTAGKTPTSSLSASRSRDSRMDDGAPLPAVECNSRGGEARRRPVTVALPRHGGGSSHATWKRLRSDGPKRSQSQTAGQWRERVHPPVRDQPMHGEPKGTRVAPLVDKLGIAVGPPLVRANEVSRARDGNSSPRAVEVKKLDNVDLGSTSAGPAHKTVPSLGVLDSHTHGSCVGPLVFDGPSKLDQAEKGFSSGPIVMVKHPELGQAIPMLGSNVEKGSSSGPALDGPSPIHSSLGKNPTMLDSGPPDTEGDSSTWVPLSSEQLFLGIPGADLSVVSKPPSVTPPSGFSWQFIAGLWSLVPSVALLQLRPAPPAPPVSSIGVLIAQSPAAADVAVIDRHIGSSSGDAVSGGDIPEVDYGTDESETDFEKSIRALLPGLDSENVQELPPANTGARRSERQRKPSSRWTEDAGFIPEPPRSAKKKDTRDELREGTSSNPLLINDWTIAQLASYCSACGIDFSTADDHKIACLEHIRMLEKTRSAPSKGSAETS